MAASFPLTADEIAKALRCPAANVRKYWPGIQAACTELGMSDVPATIGVLATIATEVASFEPINEHGGTKYFTDNYELDRRRARDLGNTRPGDGARFHGRGFIQLTGRSNYTNYGKALKVGLAANPELALDADVAARVLAMYFKDRGIPADARRGDWREVRRKVNGGYTHYDRFIKHVENLQQAVATKQKAADAGPPVLREGMRHPAVKQLKAALGPWIQKNVPVAQPEFDRTTAFGAGLGDAVEIFQRLNKLEVTRVVDAQTWAKLAQVSKPNAAAQAAKGIAAAKKKPARKPAAKPRAQKPRPGAPPPV